MVHDRIFNLARVPSISILSVSTDNLDFFKGAYILICIT